MKSTLTVFLLSTIISTTITKSSSSSVSWPRDPLPESIMNEVYFMNSKEIDWQPVEIRPPKQQAILERLSSLLHQLKKTNKLKFQENNAGKPRYRMADRRVDRKPKSTPKESEPVIRITITNLEPTGHSFSRRTYKYQ